MTNARQLETNPAAAGWHQSLYCGSAVVWLNTASGVYCYKGDRWYGRTKRGAYVCEREAIKAGYRASPAA